MCRLFCRVFSNICIILLFDQYTIDMLYDYITEYTTKTLSSVMMEIKIVQENSCKNFYLSIVYIRLHGLKFTAVASQSKGRELESR